MQGVWSDYAEKHLLPRLNGFEILMASYAMAHLKMDLLLRETGFTAKNDQRFRIFLTNSLEESHPDTGTLWANWLSSEANEANRVKRDTPVMCIIGNPPYSVSSLNKSIDVNGKPTWIGNLIADYKSDLNEKKINIDDDYIKFIRYGQYFIDKNGSGILAYISNNSYIDGITHRQMRKNLLETFDKIYILDLHGNSKKGEVCSDGSPDENVFEIMQGVSINIFIKNGSKAKNELGNVYHSSLQGKRNFKYDFLKKNNIVDIFWEKLNYSKPYFFFAPKNFEEKDNYNKGFKANTLFQLNSNGIETKCDALAIHYSKQTLQDVIFDFKNETISKLKLKYVVKKDSDGWTFLRAKESLIHDSFKEIKINYRPFDVRETLITKKSGGFIGRTRYDVMKHFLQKNIGLVIPRQTTQAYRHIFVTDKIIDGNFTASAKLFGTGSIFPLYLYPEPTALEPNPAKIPNLNMEIVDKISNQLKLAFVPEEGMVVDLPQGFGGTLLPINILDYIYAVLHSPSYREKYKEFLKIDFPRVPYPTDVKSFWQLVALGGKLRQIHLLEDPIVNTPITKYPIGGDNIVDKIRFESYLYENTLPGEEYPDYLGAVYINETQYFADLPMSAWNFYIGGYQPAQKWLKDRKGRKLEFEDIKHYQKIIVALTETEKLMKEVDIILTFDI